MRIILEGVDGAGKTTLAKILADKYKLDICHCTQYDGTDYAFYRQLVRKDNVVWDRHTIGELIYPEIFERQQNICYEDARLVLAYAREAKTKIFVLTCDSDILKKRLLSRGTEDYRIIKRCKYIDERFRFYAQMFDVPVIDTSKMTLNEIFTAVEKEDPPYQFIH